jgi:hypothetical protein
VPQFGQLTKNGSKNRSKNPSKHPFGIERRFSAFHLRYAVGRRVDARGLNEAGAQTRRNAAGWCSSLVFPAIAHAT